jgi:hypothetical protein
MTSGNFTPGDITTDAGSQGASRGDGGREPSTSPGGAAHGDIRHDIAHDIGQGDALPATHQSGAELEQRFPTPACRRTCTVAATPTRWRRDARSARSLCCSACRRSARSSSSSAFSPSRLDDGLPTPTWSTLAAGAGLTLALFGIGAGAFHLGQDADARRRGSSRSGTHPSTDEERAAAAAVLAEGGAAPASERRPHRGSMRRLRAPSRARPARLAA